MKAGNKFIHLTINDMKARNKVSIIILISIVLLASVGVLVYVQRMINIPRNEKDDFKKVFVVQSGEKVKDIAADLEKESLINGGKFFELYVWQKKLGNKIQAGKYELSPSMAIPEIANIMINGKILENQVWVTFPEGFSNSEIDRRLAENNLSKEGEFLSLDKSSALDLSRYDFLKDKPQQAGLLGYYFPDTYKFHKDASTKDIAGKMLDNFGRKLTPEMRSEIARQGKTVFETVVLASIIEKEAGSAKDMPMISGVFHNRLNIGKALESDATVNFIIGKGRSQATYEDLLIDSPYNSYKYAGLPPGPIANPGLDAIKAAIYPEKSDYFFFLTDKEGNAVYGKTFEEHLKNKEKYLK